MNAFRFPFLTRLLHVCVYILFLSYITIIITSRVIAGADLFTKINIHQYTPSQYITKDQNQTYPGYVDSK